MIFLYILLGSIAIMSLLSFMIHIGVSLNIFADNTSKHIFSNNTRNICIGLIYLIILSISVIALNKLDIRYRNKIKKYVIPKALEPLGVFKISESGELSKFGFIKCILPQNDCLGIRNHIIGSYKNYPAEFAYCEISSYLIQPDAFILAALKIDKCPKCNIVIIKNEPWNTTFGREFRGLQKVKLEFPAFSSYFTVYSNDATETSHLLTHEFMERFLKLNNDITKGDFTCAFYSDYMLIAMPTTQDFFDPSLPFFQPYTKDRIQFISRKLQNICEIPEILMLNNKSIL